MFTFRSVSGSITTSQVVLSLYRFIVREFEYNPKAIKAERDERQKLEVDLKRMYVSTKHVPASTSMILDKLGRQTHVHIAYIPVCMPPS